MSDYVYWDPGGAAIGLLLFATVCVSAFLTFRWYQLHRSLETFMVQRSAAIERTRTDGCAAAMRAQVMWSRPDWNSYEWMAAYVCISPAELIIVPDLPGAIVIASLFPPRLRAYVVPRRRLTGARWVQTPVWPGWRRVGTGDRIIAISTDARRTCYLGSRRPSELEPLLNAPEPEGHTYSSVGWLPRSGETRADI